MKSELNDLFDFISKDFKEKTNTELVIVAFVDDLDRCLKGRNVKVLEAMQLILSVSGAPLIAFLAIDSRVVVASVEDTFGDVLRNAHISGWEYLDKIVQIPFSLPEPPPEKVERLVMKTLEGAGASPKAVAARVDVLVKELRELNARRPKSLYISFAQEDGTEPEKRPLVSDVVKAWSGHNDEDKIRAVAKILSTRTSKAAAIDEAIGGEEGLEMVGRAINEALDPEKGGMRLTSTPPVRVSPKADAAKAAEADDAEGKKPVDPEKTNATKAKAAETKRGPKDEALVRTL